MTSRASFRVVTRSHLVGGIFAFAFAFALIVLGGESRALAADAGSSDDNNVKTLEKQLSDETTALSTADCNSACRALQSIRRAADKICTIEPGPRCDAARTKANDATKRVKDACPDCVLASATPEPVPADRAKTENSPPPSPVQSQAGTADRSESGRGGCASCASTDAKANGGGDLGLVLLAAFGALRICRKSTRFRRSNKK